MAKAKRPLTKKQAAVLEYVMACVEKEHRTPTIRQIGTKFKLRSTGSVRDVIAALVKKGELMKDDDVSRGVRLSPKKYTVKVTKKKREGSGEIVIENPWKKGRIGLSKVKKAVRAISKTSRKR